MANNRSSSGLKWVIFLAALGAAIFGGVRYFRHEEQDKIEFQTAKVTRGDLTQVVMATGQLNPVTNVTVGSQISGIIRKLNVDFNSPVQKGQVIAELDPSTYKAAVAQAEGDLANAKANLELAQIQAKRARELHNNKLISDSDYDTAIATLHQAEAMVQIKEAALQNAKVNLDRCTIYSPVDGIVISRSVDVGQTVAASLSAPTLFLIANNLAEMQIDANVAEADVGGVEVGQDVNFTVDAYPYRTFHGKVTQVRNAATTVQNVVTYDTVISVTNADLKLKPGMTATVSIVIARHDNVLNIPNAALRFRPPEGTVAVTPTNHTTEASAQSNVAATGPGGGNGGRRSQAGSGQHGGSSHGDRPVVLMRTVYVLPPSTNGQSTDVKLKPVKIRIGISDGLNTEVLSGLQEGDQVVTGSTSAQGENSSSPFGRRGRFMRRF